MDLETRPSYYDLRLPKFIREPPPWLQSEDLALLAKKGAFEIPETDLRAEIIRCYICYVHPGMPLIDLPGLLLAIYSDDINCQLSLLLFQAVIFAGAAFVDMHYLQELGFTTKKHAFENLFTRVKALFDLDYESDKFTVLQSLLLMIHWYDRPDDPKDGWHWIGVSSSFAFRIGLHRDPGKLEVAAAQRSLRKRLWWALFICDRLVSLGTRQPMHLRVDSYDVPMVTCDDFTLQSFEMLRHDLPWNTEILEILQQEKVLVEAFIEKAKLCVVLGHVLSCQYSAISHAASKSVRAAMMYYPRAFKTVTREFRQCDDMLRHWRLNTPTGIQILPQSVPIHSMVEAVSHLHQTQLRLLFLTIEITLYRPLAAEPSSVSSADLKAFQGICKKRVRNAAFEVSLIFQKLHEHDLTPFLSASAVTSLLAAMMYHLLILISNHSADRSASLHCFIQGRHVLQHLRKVYVSAAFALRLIDLAIIKSGAQLDKL
jgi:hypothetical protein